MIPTPSPLVSPVCGSFLYMTEWTPTLILRACTRSATRGSGSCCASARLANMVVNATARSSFFMYPSNLCRRTPQKVDSRAARAEIGRIVLKRSAASYPRRHYKFFGGRQMNDDPGRTRRWLIGASGATVLSNALTSGTSYAQGEGTQVRKSPDDADDPAAEAPVSPVTQALSEYVAATLDRDLPPEVVAKTKLHTLDTIAAMVSGSRLKAGKLAARYVESLGGQPQATVVGSGILTSAVNAALANGMSAHGDETDDSHLRGRFHPGCGIVPAALATAELAGRSGNDVLRAVALGYDIGARLIFSLGFGKLYTERNSTHSLSTTFGATAAASAMLRLNPTRVRHAFSFAAQQASR